MQNAPVNSHDVVRASGSNFASSFWFLPKEKREALDAVYAYCRLTDDIVDLAPNEQEAREKLAEWRRLTVKAFKEKSQNPVLAELALTVGRYKIPESYFQELMDGVQSDLEKKSYGNFEELYPYCYRVAGVVGLMCLEVFGYRNAKSKEYALNLGLAFQLTNILRDIRTDSGRGRTYVPDEDLKKFSISREDILSLAAFSGPGQADLQSRFKDLISFEIQRAEHYYKKAKECLVVEDRPNLVAAEVMSAVYHAILAKITSDPLAVFRSKVRLGKPETCARVLQGWLTNRFSL